MRIIYVGNPTHSMHGQTHGGYAHGRNAHFMRGQKFAYFTWENPHIICMGKPTVGMPTEEMRILYVGKKKCANWDVV